MLALVAVAGNAFAAGEGRVQGKITDAATHKPIPNAVVTIDAVSGHTVHNQYKADKDGVYRFLVLDATIPYNFTFSAPGYVPIQSQIKLALGDLTTRDVALAPGSAADAAAGSAPAAAKTNPAILNYNEGVTLANDGKVPEAIAKIEEAVAAKPDLTAGHEALARLYLRAKNYDKAIDSANKALAIDTDNQDMFGVLADSYNAKGDKAKAAEYRKKLPADATTMFNDAAKLINGGKDAEAEALLKSAIAANDKFEQAYYELGMVDVRLQKNAEAKTNLLKFIELVGPIGTATEIETKCKAEGDATTCISKIKRQGEQVATAKEMLNYVK
jgi:tetratricopeptide (TPR) repeat protein